MIIGHVSATQRKTWSLCKRKWYYEKVLELPRKPPSKGVLKGLKHHKEIEAFLKTGVDGRTGSAKAGAHVLEEWLPLAPFRGGTLGVETNLEESPLATPRGIKFKGAIDLYLAGTARGTGVPFIGDHKFKKDLELWGEKPETLRNDPQCVIYSAFAFQAEPEAQEVDFVHHQYQTEGRQYSEAVGVKVTRDEILSKFNALCSDIDSNMTHVAACKTAEEVEPTTENCDAYGGCDFKKVCPSYSAQSLLFPSRTPTNTNPNPKTDTDMSLLDEMMRQTLQLPIREVMAPAPQPIPPPVKPPPPTTPIPPPAPPKPPAQASTTTETEVTGFLPPDAPVAELKRKKVSPKSDNKAPVTSLTTDIKHVTGDKVLYIDCYPSSGATDLNPVVYAVSQELAKAMGAPDIRQVKAEGYEYGGWKSMLAYELLNQDLNKPCFINSNGINDAVIDVLRAVFPVVVRPMR